VALHPAQQSFILGSKLFKRQYQIYIGGTVKAYLFGIAALLSFAAYFLLNMVMCTFCMIPGCGVFSLAVSFFVLVGTWTFLLYNEVD